VIFECLRFVVLKKTYATKIYTAVLKMSNVINPKTEMPPKRNPE